MVRVRVKVGASDAGGEPNPRKKVSQKVEKTMRSKQLGGGEVEGEGEGKGNR